MIQKNKIKAELLSQLPGILFDEPLGKYCTFQVGGPADYFYKLKDIDSLPLICEFCHSLGIPIFVFGGGSNILFDDKGFRGLVLKLEAKQIKVEGDKISAEAGTMVSQLLKVSMENKLAGLEPWIGLPGTVGGALYGNAGCNGLETKDVLSHALIFDPKTKKIFEANGKFFHFDYRYSKLKDNKNIVLNATFNLKPRTFSEDEQKEILKSFNKIRHEKQPFGLTTGSFFKNPKGTAAGLLIDQSGLKGKQIGGAKISEKHAYFFLNAGKASSKDIIKLARLARKKVQEKFAKLIK